MASAANNKGEKEMTDDGKVKQLRKVADVEPMAPEQADLIAELTDLLKRARAGDLIGFVGVAILNDEVYSPLIAGGLYSVGDTYLQLHVVADMLKDGVTETADEDEDDE